MNRVALVLSHEWRIKFRETDYVLADKRGEAAPRKNLVNLFSLARSVLLTTVLWVKIAFSSSDKGILCVYKGINRVVWVSLQQIGQALLTSQTGYVQTVTFVK